MKKSLPMLASDSANAPPALPLLLIRSDDLPWTVKELAELLAKSPVLFSRAGKLVEIISVDGRFETRPTSAASIVALTHEVCRPVETKAINGEMKIVPNTLPNRVATLFLDRQHEANFRRLNGICTGPLLFEDGSIQTAEGYDPKSSLWCAGISLLAIPEVPTAEQALAAFLEVRRAFQTFPFADAAISTDATKIVDLTKPPGLDESSFLVSLLTAICRPSLELTPALLIRAPLISGAGSGKGLLVRALSQIAFGMQPAAFSCTSDQAELDKRLGSALLKSSPVVFLDNVNGTMLASDLLAQSITETSCQVRILGRSEMMQLNSRTFIAVTGNAVQLAEDLVRRFMVVNLDAHSESPELRKFEYAFLDIITEQRLVVLTALLTIWRWGRVNELPRGRSLGSFDKWCSWCRDPLLALGCQDPVTRLDDMKESDPHRQDVVEFLSTWFAIYGTKPVKLRDLNPDISVLAGSNQRSRQAIATYVNNLVGTRIAGYTLVRVKAAGKWGTSSYSVVQTE